jgi:hypothetical protein
MVGKIPFVLVKIPAVKAQREAQQSDSDLECEDINQKYPCDGLQREELRQPQTETTAIESDQDEEREDQVHKSKDTLLLFVLPGLDLFIPVKRRMYGFHDSIVLLKRTNYHGLEQQCKS